MKYFSVEEICSKINGVLIGHTTTLIAGPEQIEYATDQQITFIGSAKFAKLWNTSQACAVIVNDNINLEPAENRAVIKVKNADIAMSDVLDMYIGSHPVVVMLYSVL